MSTKNESLAPLSSWANIWDASNVAGMLMSTEAFFAYRLQGMENGVEKRIRCRGSAGMKCSHRGLIGTCLMAYNTHHNLSLRPDDFWTTIVAQFCAMKYADRDSSNVQPLAIHPGVDEMIDRGDFAQDVVNRIMETDDGISHKDWFVPSFSTTTSGDRVAAAMAVLGSSKAKTLADYEASFCDVSKEICGIPKVTLTGTVQDWNYLRTVKMDQLSRLIPEQEQDDYFQEWIVALRWICVNLCESAESGSRRNLDFWHNMVRREGGSEGPCISGWITLFSYYDKNGQRLHPHNHESKEEESSIHETIRNHQWPRIPIGRAAANILTCSVSIQKAPGVVHTGLLFGGQLSFDVEEDADDNIADSDHLFSKMLNQADRQNRMSFLPRSDWVLVLRCDPEPS